VFDGFCAGEVLPSPKSQNQEDMVATLVIARSGAKPAGVFKHAAGTAKSTEGLAFTTTCFEMVSMQLL